MTQLKSARNFLASILEVPVDEVPNDADIMTYSAWDSLVHLRLMLAIEDHTGVKIDPAKAGSLFSIVEIDEMLSEGQRNL